MDGAIVDEDRVGDGAELCDGLVVVHDDGLVGDVAARHHEEGGAGGQEEVVERCRGEHEAELAEARGDGGRDVVGIDCVEQDDRARGRDEDAGGGLVEVGGSSADVEIARHQREGLVGALLLAAEAGDGALVARVGGELVAAEALHGDDLPACEEYGRAFDGVVLLGDACVTASVVLEEADVRSAVRACCGLGVEAAALGVVVFGAACGAHGECVHRRGGAVVGDAADDRVAGAAVGAVHEGVTVSSIGGVEELAQACFAGGGVGGDGGADIRGGGRARDDAKVMLGAGGDRRDLDGFDAGERRSLGAEGADEAFEGASVVAFDLDEDAFRIVAHEPAEPGPLGDAKDHRAKADPLHRAANADGTAHARRSYRCSLHISVPPPSRDVKAVPQGCRSG